MTCPSCGAGAPDNARFCPTCGHGLVQRPDERRVATVVFADLVGFTTFSESADPEQVKDLVDRCFERLVGDVDGLRRPGRQDRRRRDRRPVRCPGRPRERRRAGGAGRAADAGDARRRSATSSAIDAEIRIGVNTGEVLVGALAGRRRLHRHGRRREHGEPPPDYGATGRRHRRARDTCGDPPRDPLRAARPARGEGPRRSRSRRGSPGEIADHPGSAGAGARPRSSDATSRSRVAQRARDAVERRRAHFVLLVGDAGVGKTRTRNEIGEACDRHGATVIDTHCAPVRRGQPVVARSPTRCAIAASIDSSVDSRVARGEGPRAVRAGIGTSTTDDPEVGRVPDGLLYLHGHDRLGAGVDPIARTRRRGPAPPRSLRGACRATTAGAHPLRSPLGRRAVLDVVDRLLTACTHRPFVLLATTRPDLEDRWTPRRDATTPSSSRSSRSLPMPARRSRGDARRRPPDARSSCSSNAAAATRSSSRSSRRSWWRPPSSSTPPQSKIGPRALPGTLRGLVAARLDALDPAAPRDARRLRRDRHDRLSQDRRRARRASRRRPARQRARPAGRQRAAQRRAGRVRFQERADTRRRLRNAHQGERARRTPRAVGHLAWHAQRPVGSTSSSISSHTITGAAEALVHELRREVEGLGPDLHKAALGFLTRAARQAEHRETWPVVIRLLDLALKVRDDGGSDELPVAPGARARRAAPLRRGSSRSRCGHAPRRCTGRSADRGRGPDRPR